MKELDKAKKKYWYDHNFDKSQNHWDAHVELSIFAEGWKQALEWALVIMSVGDIEMVIDEIKEELDGKSK